MKLKSCKLCHQELPLASFTSVRAKYCLACKRIRQLEQQNAMRLRAVERAKKGKQKTKGVIRISDLKKRVQRVVNKYVRERDSELGCISCGNTNANAYDAGHYINQGSSGFLRYDLDNIHKQCSFKCNHNLSGNKIEYRIALVKKIGLERVEYLENNRHKTHKWTREELLEIEAGIKQIQKG